MQQDSRQRFRDLQQALRAIPDGNFVRSLCGDANSWSTYSCRHTEFQLAEPDQWLRGLPTLARLLVPAVAMRVPPWLRRKRKLRIVSKLLLRPAKILRYSDRFTRRNPTPEQAWFFINGIAADETLACLNTGYLSQLFRRPLTILFKPSCGLLADFAESALGAEWGGVAAAARVAFPPLYAALKTPSRERVVLLCHSQGTVVAAVVLALLEQLYPPRMLEPRVDCPERRVAAKLAADWGFPLHDSKLPAQQSRFLSVAELQKLELYCFGNCATTMEPIVSTRKQPAAPWIESYGNEHDLFARLGVLAPASGKGAARIGGDRYLRPQTWGHLLNAHYLCPMAEEQQALLAGSTPKTRLEPMLGNYQSRPRLFEYFTGQSPPRLVSVSREPVTSAQNSTTI